MRYCLNCGKGIPDESKFCTFCGTPIPHVEGNMAGSTVTSPTPQTSQTFYAPQTNTRVPVSNEFYKNIGFWGAVLVFIGFFLPWQSSIYMSMSLLDSLQILNQQYAFFWLLLLFPVCAAILIIYSFTDKISKGLARICKVLPIIMFVGLIILGFADSHYDIIGVSGGDMQATFKTMGIGMWAILIGSILVLFYKKR